MNDDAMFEYFKSTFRNLLRVDRCEAAYKYLSSMDFQSRWHPELGSVQVKVVNANGDEVWMFLSDAQIKAFSDNYFFED